jgi:ribosome-associated protein
MLKKMKKGYYVKGHFVAEGSERDLELKRELKANSQIDPDKPSRTEQKAASDARQKLGVQLAGLRHDLLLDLDIPDILVTAINEHSRITNFEGKRRQMQFIGKLMRKLDETQIASIHVAIKAQANGAPRKPPRLAAATAPSST